MQSGRPNDVREYLLHALLYFLWKVLPQSWRVPAPASLWQPQGPTNTLPRKRGLERSGRPGCFLEDEQLRPGERGRELTLMSVYYLPSLHNGAIVKFWSPQNWPLCQAVRKEGSTSLPQPDSSKEFRPNAPRHPLSAMTCLLSCTSRIVLVVFHPGEKGDNHHFNQLLNPVAQLRCPLIQPHDHPVRDKSFRFAAGERPPPQTGGSGSSKIPGVVAEPDSEFELSVSRDTSAKPERARCGSTLSSSVPPEPGALDERKVLQVWLNE